MSELTDIRRDPRTKVYNYVTVDPEVYTVAEFANLPGVFGVLLKFRPDPSNTLIEYTYDDTPLTKVTSFSPGLGEVYIDYVQGYCIVNADDDGVEIRATYKGGGGLNHKRNLELLATFSGKTTDDLTEGATNKYASAANAAGFVNAATDKTTPVDADRIGFTDSAASYVLKRFTFANLFTWIVSKVFALTGKTTPVDADQLFITDSAASNVGKSLTWANLKATLLAYFDTQYKEQIAIIENQQTNGTGGGALGASNTWVKNQLNTIVSDPGGIVTSLVSSVITLPAGTYRFEWSSLTYQVDEVQSRLRNTADSISYLGSTAFGGATINLPSTGVTEPITIAGSKTFELQANASTNYGANDFGRPSSRGVGEVYSRLIITKVG